MTLQEVKELKVPSYGELCFKNKLGYYITCTGTIIFITKKGTVTFYDNDKGEHFKRPDEIKSFTPKDMLPPPTEYKGKPIIFDNGRWTDKRGREIDLKR